MKKCYAYWKNKKKKECNQKYLENNSWDYQSNIEQISKKDG